VLRHPGREDLAGFLDTLETGSAGMLLHLLRCDVCAAYAIGKLAPPEQTRGALTLLREAMEVDYSALWQRLDEINDSATRQLREERSDAEPLLKELLRRQPAERPALVRTDPRFRSWSLADLLLEEARAKPAERDVLAELVLVMVETGLGGHAERLSADLVAAASCEVGEARRARGDLAGAEAAFEQAARSLRASLDAQERARFCHLLAALRRDQGRLDEAIALLDRAADLLEESGNHQARAAALVEAGMVCLDAGEPERALAAFDDATSLERNLSPEIAFTAARGTALALVYQGQLHEAVATLAGARQVYPWTEETLPGLRLLALQARIMLSTGPWEAAVSYLRTAFEGLVRLGEPRDALVAAVHLARALAEEGRSRRAVREVANQMQPLLAAPTIPDEARRELSSFIEDARGSARISPRRLKEIAELLERP
jgi:tetratricopeptide (TPR) repeat protein